MFTWIKKIIAYSPKLKQKLNLQREALAIPFKRGDTKEVAVWKTEMAMKYCIDAPVIVEDQETEIKGLS